MLMTSEHVAQQHKVYGEMPGVGFGHLCAGFVPAFRDEDTGEVHLSVNPDGQVAIVHVIDQLPLEWINEWDGQGRAISLRGTVTPGFLRGESFYTLAELKSDLLDA